MAQKITWQRMLELKDLNIEPFFFKFVLLAPVDRHGDICFGEKEVDYFLGSMPHCKAQDEESGFLAVSCEKIYVTAV